MASITPGSAALRGVQVVRPLARSTRRVPYNSFRQAHSRVSARSARYRWALTLPIVGLFVISDIYRRQTASVSFDAPPIASEAEVVVEKSKKMSDASKEEIRILISSQHLQVKKSWENPGVYAWGSNSGKVVAPDSKEAFIKTPRRIPFFDGILLRDLKLDRNFGAAINESGDLFQWGKDYCESETTPSVTMKGKDLVSLAVSKDRVLALSRSGKVYSIPVSKADQAEGHKPTEGSWLPFWSDRASISYRLLSPEKLGIGEKVTAVSAGLEHALLLTNRGRVFSVSASSNSYPSRGQLGIPGLTYLTRPPGDIDTCHEIGTLKGFQATNIAAGDYHSLVLDKEGRVFSFGDNSSGQLGFDYSSESPCIDAPSLLPLTSLYSGTNQVPRITSIAAGGLNTFFTVDATRVRGRDEDPNFVRTLGRVTADTWACGQGIKGNLGNGRWTHIQGMPTKIPSLSGLFEYDEKTNKTIPIRLSSLSVGSTHASAIMANVTNLSANKNSSENDTNWGADVVWWGSNEFYQIGTGKRNNINSPIYIAPLDVDAEKAVGRDQTHRLQITPKRKVSVKGKNVAIEQKIECGRFVTAVYSAV